MPQAVPIPLRGLVDTGSGVTILSFSTFNRVAVQTEAVLKPYQIDLYAANGKNIKTYGMAEHVRFQLGGYELGTNCVVVDDAMGVEDFLSRRNFLRAYQVFVDLTSMKIVSPASVQPLWHYAHTQVGDPSLAVPVAIDGDLALELFERTVVKSIVDASLQNVVFLDKCVATVSKTGHVFVSVMNLTCNPQRIRGNTHLGTVVPVLLV